MLTAYHTAVHVWCVLCRSARCAALPAAARPNAAARRRVAPLCIRYADSHALWLLLLLLLLLLLEMVL